MPPSQTAFAIILPAGFDSGSAQNLIVLLYSCTLFLYYWQMIAGDLCMSAAGRYGALAWEFPSWAAINGPAFNILKGAVAVSDRIVTVSQVPPKQSHLLAVAVACLKVAKGDKEDMLRIDVHAATWSCLYLHACLKTCVYHAIML